MCIKGTCEMDFLIQQNMMYSKANICIKKEYHVCDKTTNTQLDDNLACNMSYYMAMIYFEDDIWECIVNIQWFYMYH